MNDYHTNVTKLGAVRHELFVELEKRVDLRKASDKGELKLPNLSTPVPFEVWSTINHTSNEETCVRGWIKLPISSDGDIESIQVDLIDKKVRLHFHFPRRDGFCEDCKESLPIHELALLRYEKGEKLFKRFEQLIKNQIERNEKHD